MRLWTVQHPAAWETLRSGGVLRADGRRVWREFRPAYRWMMGRMRERLPGYSGRYPLWAWLCPKPDLRRSGWAPRGWLCVRIEFVLSEEEAHRRVLPSDFGAFGWAVLNRWHLSLTEEEHEAFGRRAGGPGRYANLPDALKDEVRASWERAFDLGAMRGSMWADPTPGAPQAVQAVLEEIRPEEVGAVRAFRAR